MSSYERDMSIDVTALDVEWTEQAELAMKYGRLWAEAQDATSRAEEKVKYVRSKLTMEVIKKPAKCLGVGIAYSDAKAEAYYRTHPEYIEAKDEWLDCLNNLNTILVAKSEISFTRKSALENLVVLHGQNYFAGPNVPRDLKNEMNQRKESRKQANEKANSRMRRITR